MDRLPAPPAAPDAFAALGRAIAEQFNVDQVAGGGWTSEARLAARYGEVFLHHPCGAHVSIRHQGGHRVGRAGRLLTVEGRFPEAFTGRPPNPFRPSIDRRAADIARSIATRWLPGYLAVVDRAQVDQAASDAKAVRRTEVNRQMARALEGTGEIAALSAGRGPARTDSSWSGRSLVGLPDAMARGRATLNEAGTHMQLRLDSVPVELGLRILQLLEPRDVLEGRIMPIPLAPHRSELPTPAAVITGDCSPRAGTPDTSAEPSALRPRDSP